VTLGEGGSATAPASLLGGGSAGTAAGAAASAGLLGAGPLQALGLGAPHPLVGLARRRALASGSLSQRALERTVAQLHGCLDQLSDEQRRVLSLRAGLGPRPALSRTHVAHRLGLGVATTRRIERRALRRLGAADGAGQCVAGGASASAGAMLLLGSSPFALADGSTLAAAGDGGASGPRSGIKGVSDSGGGASGGSSLGDALPPPIGDGSDWTLLILLMLFGMLGLLVRRELRRR
jgi:hypothetical protein